MGEAQRRRQDRDRTGTPEEGCGAPEHLAAIARLRRIAEQGLGECVLNGLDDSEEADGGAGAADTDAATGSQARAANLRILEAVLFAASEPVSEKRLARYIEGDADIPALLAALQARYAEGGVNLVRIGTRWMFRTADDLGYLLEEHAVEQRRLSKAALETLAIIAYHQPVTRAEIEDVRGVTISKGTLDVLMETGWVRPRGRRRAPGKPVTYGTTEAFLAHFGLDGLGDLPGLADLKASGLLSSDLPADFAMPSPQAVAALLPDELPLEEADAALLPAVDEEEDEAGDADTSDDAAATRGAAD